MSFGIVNQMKNKGTTLHSRPSLYGWCFLSRIAYDFVHHRVDKHLSPAIFHIGSDWHVATETHWTCMNRWIDWDSFPWVQLVLQNETQYRLDQVSSNTTHFRSSLHEALSNFQPKTFWISKPKCCFDYFRICSTKFAIYVHIYIYVYNIYKYIYRYTRSLCIPFRCFTNSFSSSSN